MRLIGCDLHASQQSIAMLDRDTGAVIEKTLKHEGEAVREFHSFCFRGLEGSTRWRLEGRGMVQRRFVLPPA